MNSSTSNSSGEAATSTTALDWAACVAAAVWPTVAGAAVFVLVASLGWARTKVSPPTGTLEDVIIRTQLQRASSLNDVDVLLVGDSSGLMDVDAAEVQARLHQTVESLASIGFVGPNQQVRIANRITARRHHIGTLVLLLNGESLALSENFLSGQPFEGWVRDGERPRRGAWRDIRDFGYDETIGVLVARPLPGAFGSKYGFQDDLEAAIQSQHGTAEDPNSYHDATHENSYQLTMSEAVRARLKLAAQAIEELHVNRVLVGITPLPNSAVGPSTGPSRDRILSDLNAELKAEVLELPLAFPDSDFATFTHLNGRGRRKFTTVLSDELERKLR